LDECCYFDDAIDGECPGGCGSNTTDSTQTLDVASQTTSTGAVFLLAAAMVMSA
jgi:hypothetical protein